MIAVRGGVLAPAAFFLFAAVLGGSGGGYPLIEMSVDIAGILLLVVTLSRPIPPIPGLFPALAFIFCLILVPLLQMLPLPPSIWAHLPGRAPIAQLDAVRGALQSRPLSLAPEATGLHALSLIPPVALFLATVRCSAADRRALLFVVVIAAIASAILGVLQVASGSLYFYDTAHAGYPIGFFINRNHQATLMLVTMPLIACLVATDEKSSATIKIAGGFILLLLAIATLTTTSRIGMLLLPPVLYATIILMFRLRWQRAVLALLLLVVGLLLIAFLLDQSTVGANALGRLMHLEDQRSAFWEGTRYAIGVYWPAGTGIGSFVPVYASVEDLNSVGQLYVNHAHDDYLEWLLEAGVAAPILLAGFSALAIRQCIRPFRRTTATMRNAAMVVILIVAAHSVVDYPLRMLSLLSLFGLACGLLFDPAEAANRRRTAPRRSAEARLVT